jgi:hypothetical protein
MLAPSFRGFHGLPGYNYASFTTQLATLAVVEENDPAFQTILPSAIEYAENRICRDLDLLSTVASNTSFALTTNVRSLTIPTETFITTQEINVLTPAGVSDPTYATRNPLIPVAKEFLDFVYPSSSSAGVPMYYAMRSQTAILFGPWPDQNYSVEIVGTFRPETLSASNTETFIATWLPDLMIAAAMVYVSGYQRDFSAAGSDPNMPIQWEGQYVSLKNGAMVEEYRKKYQASAWTSQSPPVIASPTR